MTADRLILIMMLISAVYIVGCRNYKRIIIAVGAFSLLASFCYLLYHAPDVAIAEAIIGSALSTILYIVALKKHRTFYIFLTTDSKEQVGDQRLRAGMEDVIKKIMTYCVDHELEAQVVFSSKTPQIINARQMYDLILYNSNEHVTVYGSTAELHVVAIKKLLEKSFSTKRISFIAMSKEETA